MVQRGILGPLQPTRPRQRGAIGFVALGALAVRAVDIGWHKAGIELERLGNGCLRRPVPTQPALKTAQRSLRLRAVGVAGLACDVLDSCGLPSSTLVGQRAASVRTARRGSANHGPATPARSGSGRVAAAWAAAGSGRGTRMRGSARASVTL